MKAAASPLLALQTRFQEHMLGRVDATALLSGRPERRALGLAIYANAYRQRLVDALADAHAKTHALLGEPAFEACARTFIDAHPPTTRSLRWFGAGFSDHLNATLPDPSGLAELARLEWALRNAFDGPDSAVLSATDLAGVAPAARATLRLAPVPTTELLRFSHNTVAVWQALDDERPPPPFERGAVPVDWLVWRKGLQPHFRSLHPLEAGLLHAMRAGAGFAQACEQAQAESSDDEGGQDSGQDGGPAARIGACLRQWMDDGVLSGVGLAPDDDAGS